MALKYVLLLISIKFQLDLCKESKGSPIIIIGGPPGGQGSSNWNTNGNGGGGGVGGGGGLGGNSLSGNPMMAGLGLPPNANVYHIGMPNGGNGPGMMGNQMSQMNQMMAAAGMMGMGMGMGPGMNNGNAMNKMPQTGGPIPFPVPFPVFASTGTAASTTSPVKTAKEEERKEARNPTVIVLPIAVPASTNTLEKRSQKSLLDLSGFKFGETGFTYGNLGGETAKFGGIDLIDLMNKGGFEYAGPQTKASEYDLLGAMTKNGYGNGDGLWDFSSWGDTHGTSGGTVWDNVEPYTGTSKPRNEYTSRKSKRSSKRGGRWSTDDEVLW